MQKMHTGPDLTIEKEIDLNVPEILTKRIVMSQLMSIFDSCGLISPFKMKGAILFRRTWQCSKVKGNSVDWDAAIPDDLVTNWIKYFHSFIPEIVKNGQMCKPNFDNFM